MFSRGIVATLFLFSALCGFAQQNAEKPWMNRALTADQRADLLLHAMTLDEKITLMHGEGLDDWPHMSPAILAARVYSNGGDGFSLGVPRLGIPALQMIGSAYGIRFSALNGRYSTALPSDVASAASWDTDAACQYGALIGRELRAQGYNVSLGGGVNLTREPRDGRTFEYMGEDPVLAGTMVGHRIRCEGDQHVITGIKHYAMNDQESGRSVVDSVIDEKAMRESDLLAFQIGVRIGHPYSVMCSYNGVNGTYACENKLLLNGILKHEWGFKGFVMSDWGGTHSMEKASAAGLDQEQPLDEYYGPTYKAAVQEGRISQAEMDDHVHRILWSMFASGIMDDPPQKRVIDPEEGFRISRKLATDSAVLLRNEKQTLPLDRTKLKSVAVIGLHADTGMISGAGSAQVDPIGSTAPAWRSKVWFPTSPLKALQAKAPGATFTFHSGEDVAQAAEAARHANVAIIFAWQWMGEAADLHSLSLPNDQDHLIAAVAAANPHTVVVLETGGAVTMPWLKQTAAVLETWYAGSKGADAVADLLFGDANPSGKLPITFPLSENDLPRPVIDQPTKDRKEGVLNFQVHYTEGANVGYKWFATQHKPVLFPFGFGLSYTQFRYSNLRMAPDGSTATLTLTNTGKRTGAEVAEVYVDLPAVANTARHLAGWQKVTLAPGESKAVTIAIEPTALQIWDEKSREWQRPRGQFSFHAGASSQDLPLSATAKLD